MNKLFFYYRRRSHIACPISANNLFWGFTVTWFFFNFPMRCSLTLFYFWRPHIAKKPTQFHDFQMNLCKCPYCWNSRYRQNCVGVKCCYHKYRIWAVFEKQTTLLVSDIDQPCFLIIRSRDVLGCVVIIIN